MQDLLQSCVPCASEKNEAGFTLIELLVVVVIIGILIAIAIPLYLNYENGAKNKSSASDLRAAISTIEQCYTDNNNTYPATFTIGGGSDSADTVHRPEGQRLVGLRRSSTTSRPVPAPCVLDRAPSSTRLRRTWYCYTSPNGGSVKTETGRLRRRRYVATC